MEPVCSGQIEIGFIDRGHFDLWRKAVQDSEHFLRALTVALGVPFDENRVRAQFRGGAQRQGAKALSPTGMLRRDNAALIRFPAHHDRFPFQRRVEQLFNGDEERVHVDMADQAWHTLVGKRHEVSSTVVASMDWCQKMLKRSRRT